MNQITPVVRQLLIINVVIYVGLLMLNSAGTNGKTIFHEYFKVHKVNVLGIHKTIEVYGTDYMANPNASWEQIREYQEYVDQSREEREKIVQDWHALDQFKPIQVVTYFFSHDVQNFYHILFNMMALFFLGPSLEMVMGQKRFLRFYLFCGVFAGIALALFDPSLAPVLGASTAVSGVLIAFAMMFPRQKISLLFLPMFRFEVRWLALVAVGVSLFFSIAAFFDPGAGGGVSHFGHLMGIVGAVLYFYVEKFLPQT